MLRTLIGFAFLAIVAIVAVKLLAGVLGFVVSLLLSLLWLAAIGFAIYLVLSLVSPPAARRVREWIRGRPTAG